MAYARWRRGRYWTGVPLAVLLLVAGGLVAYTGYTAANAPDAVVRGYFAALVRSDAPAALSFGDVPAGPRALLTGDVLQAQQRIAPITHVSVTTVRRSGAKVRVHVRYLLGFPGAERQVETDVPVHQHAGTWRLDRVAIATQLHVLRAVQRATVVGAGIPAGTVLLFPGAVPITFDTPYLQLDPGSAAVAFGADPTTVVDVQVSDEGRRQAAALVSAALSHCLTVRAMFDCPQPSESYVPGSLRGSLPSVAPDLSVSVGDSPVGVLQVAGDVSVLGTYRRLTFANRAVSGRGRVVVVVRAEAYAVAPMKFAWTRP